jgi:hypothetical protein
MSVWLCDAWLWLGSLRGLPSMWIRPWSTPRLWNVLVSYEWTYQSMLCAVVKCSCQTLMFDLLSNVLWPGFEIRVLPACFWQFCVPIIGQFCVPIIGVIWWLVFPDAPKLGCSVLWWSCGSVLWHHVVWVCLFARVWINNCVGLKRQYLH